MKVYVITSAIDYEQYECVEAVASSIDSAITLAKELIKEQLREISIEKFNNQITHETIASGNATITVNWNTITIVEHTLDELTYN